MLLLDAPVPRLRRRGPRLQLFLLPLQRSLLLRNFRLALLRALHKSGQWGGGEGSRELWVPETQPGTGLDLCSWQRAEQGPEACNRSVDHHQTALDFTHTTPTASSRIPCVRASPPMPPTAGNSAATVRCRRRHTAGAPGARRRRQVGQECLPCSTVQRWKQCPQNSWPQDDTTGSCRMGGRHWGFWWKRGGGGGAPSTRVAQ
jgi:hypothetical protein